MVLNPQNSRSQHITSRDNLAFQELSHAVGEYNIKFMGALCYLKKKKQPLSP